MASSDMRLPRTRRRGRTCSIACSARRVSSRPARHCGAAACRRPGLPSPPAAKVSSSARCGCGTSAPARRDRRCCWGRWRWLRNCRAGAWARLSCATPSTKPPFRIIAPFCWWAMNRSTAGSDSPRQSRRPWSFPDRSSGRDFSGSNCKPGALRGARGLVVATGATVPSTSGDTYPQPRCAGLTGPAAAGLMRSLAMTDSSSQTHVTYSSSASTPAAPIPMRW